ncbi:MAG: response regulator [Opitutus sp.]
MPKKKPVPKHDTDLQTRLGNAVRSHRRRLGITQEELAWRAAMHRTYLADIERGGRNITLRSVAHLADALQIPLESLLAGARDLRSKEAPANASAGSIGTVLLVEDNGADVELTLRAFDRARFTNPIKVVRDGQEALDYLFPGGKISRRKIALPGLVLLDLNLPKVSGIEVLRRIKTDPVTRNIPVVILALSRRDRDILECSRLGAQNYMIKPVSFDGFCKLTPQLSLRWALLNSGA